jgi:cell division protein FtsA
MAGTKDHLICTVDVGTTKICVLISRALPDGSIEIVSNGYALSSGLKKGTVVDLEEAASAIRRAREEAESRSNLSVDMVTIGITGDHIKSFNCHGAIQIEGKNQEVTSEDIEQVIHAAQSIPMRNDRAILHVLTQEFMLDGREIPNAVGLTGSRLDANIHVVTCDNALLQNLINAVNKAEMRVKRVVLQHLASAEAVLTGDEKELGVAVIDIGGGTSDISLFTKNAVRFTSFIPVGGANFTRDLAIGLRTPLEAAEQIKKDAGSVNVDAIGSDETVNAPSVGGRDDRTQSRVAACGYLKDRAVELFGLLRDELESAGGCEKLVAGIVLTGGGSTLDGMIELAELELRVPVRQGLPMGVTGLTEELNHPVYATAIGLAKFISVSGMDLRAPAANEGFWLKKWNWILSKIGE